MNLHYDMKKGGLSLKVNRYIEKLERQFHVTITKRALTPLFTPTVEDSSTEPIVSEFYYQSRVGSLVHAATCCRPDIQFLVNFVSQGNQTHNEAMVKTVDRILSYAVRKKIVGQTPISSLRDITIPFLAPMLRMKTNGHPMGGYLSLVDEPCHGLQRDTTPHQSMEALTPTSSLRGIVMPYFELMPRTKTNVHLTSGYWCSLDVPYHGLQKGTPQPLNGRSSTHGCHRGVCRSKNTYENYLKTWRLHRGV